MTLTLDDTEAALPIFSDVCAHCKHWIRSPGRKCHAFPKGIPLPIWLGENNHRLPYAGDHNIQFAPIAKLVPAQEAIPAVKLEKRTKMRKRRFLIRPYLQREAELRARLWQDPQTREKIVEILKSELKITNLEQMPSIETLWLNRSGPVKAKLHRGKFLIGK